VKRLKRAAFVLLALVALLMFGLLPYWLGGLATTRRFQFSDKENAGLTPAKLGLSSEDASFRAVDGVELSGWWVPAAQRPGEAGTVVLLHGLNRSRIEMARKLPFLHERGWNALAFDLRHHGTSGGSATTFGVREKDDAAAAVAFARQRASGPIVLWGVSLGGATAALASAADPSIAGLVCDSSFSTLSETLEHHLRLFRGFRWWMRAVPAWPTASLVRFWIGRRGAFDPQAADVMTAVRQLRGRPSLFVCNSGDRRMPATIAHALKAAAGPPAELLEVTGNSHGGAWRDGTQAYGDAVTRMLERVSAAQPQRTSGLSWPGAGGREEPDDGPRGADGRVL
jgi:pimeloyl-ACP methyl ester carboxylesterase